MKVMPPSSIEGIEKYLGSGMIKGIGPHFAKKLVKAFGEDIFDVIENAPERLKGLDGIGPKRVEKITSGWADQKAIREIMVFLQSHGVRGEFVLTRRPGVRIGHHNAFPK